MQDISIKTNPVPSKLYAYQRFYEHLDKFEKDNINFSVTEFGCGGSKILKFFNPFFYQGIDLNEEKILDSKKKYSDKNYNFYKGDMLNFESKQKTNYGLCFQTFGINISFNNENLLICLNNLNNHIHQNGSIVFNMSSELYMNNKDFIDEFCKKNYSSVNYIFYGIFNKRFNNLLTKILVRIEHLLSYKKFSQKYIYIKCEKKYD